MVDPDIKTGRWDQIKAAKVLLGLAILIAVAKPILPDFLVRIPDWAILPYDIWLQHLFDFIKDDLGLLKLTRAISGVLELFLNTMANLLHGKRRWPNLGPIPWTSIAVAGAIIGYWLGGWRLALLSGGTFVWTALIGQWKLAMQTMAVLSIAAPVAFFVGLVLGIIAWKYDWFDRAIRPVLSVLQTLPFFTYLLPAVIFFKVGPTAAAVATIVYAIPPMVLMKTLGLKKVSHEVVEAGKMSGCTRWQMLRYVYIPAARSEILVGVNQVIMLCLAMVVLTAFIGMPGLGAKLLAMMGSFKLGRSFEIGVTIVLLAVMLDRCSKAWVIKQPLHFERGTPWWQRHKYLLTVITLYTVISAVIISMLIGIPLGIVAARDETWAKRILLVCDTAQTFPSFIYLIPAIMLFGVNDVAVVFSIVIFATVPLTRYTIEGLRTVPEEMTEAADMAGATRHQKLISVQLPLALPTMAVGFNQAIMFAFFMVIIAAFIGTQDLGQELQKTLAGADLGKNFVLGMNVSLMALTFDLIIMSWATKRKNSLGLSYCC